MNIDDTIVAVSSPPGAAARGIIRLSGPAARQIADGLFRAEDGLPLHDRGEKGYIPGSIQVGPGRLPASAYLFLAPRSFTRQDLVELHLLGAPGVLGIVVESALLAGARRAQAGEFTARAFFAGLLDLSQVHGIAGLISATSDQELRAAERLLHGHLSRQACTAREELADLLSLIEGAMDFADEPIEFITPATLRQRLASLRGELSRTLAAGARAQRWGRLPRVLLVGRPNAGKSSLLNRLTGSDRAICTPIAGTTRDVLSAPLALESMECMLIDMAGLDASVDELDAKSRSAAGDAITDADLLLYIVDITTYRGEIEMRAEGKPCIQIGNKSDLLSPPQRARPTAYSLQPTALFLTSALTGEGCEELIRMIERALCDRSGAADDASIALMAEHREALRRATASIDRAIELASQCEDNLAGADLVAAELHAAAASLAELVGQDHPEDLLGRIFARFCVGK